MKHLIKDLVSVVVPVYNTLPEYLSECFESVKNQDYEKRELVIVNDGSTNEETVLFCREYVKDNNEWCVLVEQENKGVSVARNTGIVECSGSRLMFLDSDDSLEPDAISTLNKAMDENGCDAVIGQDYVKNGINKVETYIDNDIMSALIHNVEASFGWALWGKMFDTNLMRFYYVSYEDIYYGEDLLVNASYFSNSNKAVVINEKVYNYRRDNTDSAMNQAVTSKKLTLIKMWLEMERFYVGRGLDEEIKMIRANYYNSLLSGLFECNYFMYKNYRHISKQIRTEICDNMRDIFKNPYVKDKFKYVLATHAMWIFKLARKIKKGH